VRSRTTTRSFPGWLEPLVAALDEDPPDGRCHPSAAVPGRRLNDAGGLVFAGRRRVGVTARVRRSRQRRTSPADGGDIRLRRMPAGATTAFRRRWGGFGPRYAPRTTRTPTCPFSLRSQGWTPALRACEHDRPRRGRDRGDGRDAGTEAYQPGTSSASRENGPTSWARGRPLALDGRGVGARRSLGIAPGKRPAGRLTAQPKSILVIDPPSTAYDVASGSRRLFELVKCLRAQAISLSFLSLEQAFDRAKYAEVLGRDGITLDGVYHGGDPRQRSGVGLRPSIQDSARTPATSRCRRRRDVDHARARASASPPLSASGSHRGRRLLRSALPLRAA
jgi:hypothetical protein